MHQVTDHRTSIDSYSQSLFDRACALHREGRLREALEVYQAALRQDSSFSSAFFNLGLIYLHLNQPENAIASYRNGLALNGSNHTAYFNLAQACEQLEDIGGAVEAYGQALSLHPEYVDAAYNLSCLHLKQARWQEACRWLERSVALDPDHAPAWNNLGQAYSELNETHKAIRCYARAHTLDPGLMPAACNLGQLLQMEGRHEEAVDVYCRTIATKPDSATVALNNLGNIYKEQGQLAAAVECYRKVVALSPELCEGHYNLGSTLRLTEAFEEASIHLLRAVQLRSDYADAWNNLALTYKNIGDLDRALAGFDRALQINPELAVARWNRSSVHLLKDNFRNGWTDFESRFRIPQKKSIYPFQLGGLRWKGHKIPDATLLVHDEQGLGDTIQFVRYLPLVKTRCRQIILETRPELVALLRRCEGVDRIIVRSIDGVPAAKYDHYVPLMSLPAIFQTAMDTIPNTVPYIAADKNKIDHWRQRLSDTGFRIGLVWSGRPQHTNDCNRSCSLLELMPLLETPGVRFYGLQTGPGADQSVHLPENIHFTSLKADLKDFDDTAAVIANLDLVISVDTAVAHLTGAMGKPIWAMIPFIPDWRWGLNRAQTGWYPTMNLFRQPCPKDWKSVVKQLRAELLTFL